MQNTQEITAALKEQYDAIATRLAAIDREQAATLAQYKEQRAKVAAEAAPLAQALKALGVQVAGFTATANGTRKPMSEEAKQRIREGLKKAAERKAAAAQAVTVPPNAQGQGTAKAEQSGPVPAPAKKAVPARKAVARG